MAGPFEGRSYSNSRLKNATRFARGNNRVAFAPQKKQQLAFARKVKSLIARKLAEKRKTIWSLPLALSPSVGEGRSYL